MTTKSKEMKHRPGSATPSPSQRNRRTGSSDKDTFSSSGQEKTIPSYLRPTISSSKSSANQHHHPESSPTKKTAPIDKASSSLSPRKASLLLSPRKLPSSSPSPTLSKITNKTNNAKATLPSRTNARNFTRGSYSAATRKQEAKAMAPKVKVLLVDVESRPINIRSRDNEETSEGERSLHYDASEESMCGCDDLATSEEGDSRMYTRDYVKKTMLHNLSNVESETKKSDFMQGKALSPNNGEKKEAHNKVKDIIEETTSKPRERRNKVLALVGAFETAISFNEPEGQQTPWKGESQNGQPKDEEKLKGGEIGQESYLQNSEEWENNVVEAKNLEEVLIVPIDVEEKVKEEVIDGEIGQESQQQVNNQTDQHILKEGENNIAQVENLKEVLTELVDVEDKVHEEFTKSTEDGTNAIEEEKLSVLMEKFVMPTEENDNVLEEKIVSLVVGNDTNPEEEDATI